MKIAHACGVSLLAAMAAGTAFAQSEPPTEGAFTIVVLPDTQNYADRNQPHLNHYFRVQTEWIVANRDKHDIRYVLSLGDIVQYNDESEWPIARDAYDVLQEAGIPYSITGGNHDYGPNGNGGAYDSLLNDSRFFGPESPYAQQPQIGGFLGEPDKTDSSWHTFEANGQPWLFISTEWAPRDFVLARINEVIQAHPDHNVIITTHAHLFNSSARYDGDIGSQNWNPKNYPVGALSDGPNDGQDIWEKVLSVHPNIKLIMNGHVLNDGTGYLRSVGFEGHIVNEYLSNFQMRADGGQSWLTLLEFHPDGETVRVRSYNPYLDEYDLAADRDFTLVVTDRRVGPDHERQTLDLDPLLYYRLMTADAVQRDWGTAVANDGTLGAAADVDYAGDALRAYRFDGGDGLAVRGELDALPSWTVAGWVRVFDASAETRFVELRDESGASLRIELQAGEGDTPFWSLIAGADDAAQTIRDLRALNVYNWYHLVASYGDGALRFYVDGMLIEEVLGLGDALALGASEAALGAGLHGELGEFALFDRALSFGEVNQLFLSAFNRVIAGNLRNDNPTVDANNAAPITVIEQSFPGISITNTNRGDHELFLGNALQQNPQNAPTLGRPAIAGDGVMLATVRQNNRDGIPISVEVGWNSFSTGVLSLATADVGNSIANSPKENNVDTAVAWFSYIDGWTAGHVNRNGVLVNGNAVTPDMFLHLPLGDAGRFIADFGVDTRSDGLLFTVGANNAFNLTAATPREDGSAWDIRVVSNANGTGVQADFSFLYLRSDLDGLIGGAYDGAADEALNAYGEHELNRLDTGLYRVTVPSGTPDTGMLILSAADVAAVAALSYEADEDGSFVVQAIDPLTAERVDTAFNWAFISFESPIEFDGTDALGEPDIALPADQLTPPIDLNFSMACIDTYTPQEDRNSTYRVSEDGTAVFITGNGWKRLLGDFTIAPDTVLDFEFSSSVIGEVAGIGFDTQDFMTERLSFKVYGTQAWGVRDYENYNGSGDWQRFLIPIGQYYTGDFTRLFFINDQDAVPLETNQANFRNIRIYAIGQAASDPLQFDLCDVKTHGGTQRDFAEHEVLDDGLTLHIAGNGRKRVDVDYLITPNTVLEFDFRSSAETEGEVHGIGLDNNNVETDSGERVFTLFGVEEFGNLDFNDYAGDGEWRSYRIPVGQYYTGLARNIFFISEDGRDEVLADSAWRNVRVYEDNGPAD